MTLEEREQRKQQRRQDKYNKEHKIINGIDHKLCNKHHIYFPDEGSWIPATTEYFYYNDKNSSDYLYPTCKKCSVVKAGKWNEEHPDIKKVSVKKHYDSKQGKLNRTRRNQEWRDKGGLKNLYHKDPERFKEYNNRHRQHDITDAEWKDCLKTFDNKCAYCGISEQEHKQKYNEVLHKDHIIHNGYNDLRNAVPGCKRCNSSKYEFDMIEWYKEQDFFSEGKLNLIKWWMSEGYKEYIEDKPPYRIIRKQNEDKRTYHFELWTVDEFRNFIECIHKRDKKKEIIEDIKKGIIKI